MTLGGALRVLLALAAAVPACRGSRLDMKARAAALWKLKSNASAPDVARHLSVLAESNASAAETAGHDAGAARLHTFAAEGVLARLAQHSSALPFPWSTGLWLGVSLAPVGFVVLFAWLASGFAKTSAGRPSVPSLAGRGAAAGMAILEEERPNVIPIVLSILGIAVPNVVGGVLALMNEVTSTVFVGQVGTKAELAAVGLGNMMQNCIAVSIGFGIAGALDTLVSQASGGGRPVLACHYLQRCRLLTSAQLVWMIPLLFFSEPILIFVGQDAEVARLAGEYLRVTCLGFFFMFQTAATTTFLRNQGDVIVPVLVSMAGCALHLCLCALFVLRLHWGNFGVGCANVIGNVATYLATSVYLVTWSRASGMGRKSLLWVEEPGFRDLGAYMRLAGPTTLTTCTEWWFWEINAFFAGLLGQTSMAAFVATGNFNAVCFMPAMGLGAASATLVGNAVGANLPRKARTTAFLCVGVTLGMWTVLAYAVFCFRVSVSRAYSTDPEVQATMQQLLVIFVLSGFGDSTQAVIGGALRGVGKQATSAIIYVTTYYGVILPVGLYMCFKLGMGIFGIWWSFVFGTGLAASIFVVLLVTTDFQKVAAETATRLASSRSSGVWRRPTKGVAAPSGKLKQPASITAKAHITNTMADFPSKQSSNMDTRG